jgi:hypothetical protein
MSSSEIEKMTLEVKEDPKTGDYYLAFPQDLLDRLGWQEGDTIVWTQLDDQSWSLNKSGQQDVSV